MNLDERLRLSSCLDDYKLQEIVVVAVGELSSSSSSNQQQHRKAVLSVEDLPAMMKKSDASKSKSALRGTMSENALHAEKKKRGIFGIFFGKNKKGSVSIQSFIRL